MNLPLICGQVRIHTWFYRPVAAGLVSPPGSHLPFL